MTELCSGDKAIAILVEHSEGLPDLLLARNKVCVKANKFIDSH